MKKGIIFLVSSGVLAGLALAGCGRVIPGPTATREFEAESFSSLQVSSALEVEVTRSDVYTVSVTAPERLFDYIKVENSGATLILKVESGWPGWFATWGSSRPKATVGMPELHALRVSGASRVTATGFESSLPFETTISGASKVSIDIEASLADAEITGASRLAGRLKTEDIRLEASGASRVDLSGVGTTLDVNVSGASTVEMDNLSVRDAKVTLSGASRATVAPEDKITVALSGASTLTYTGSPSVDAIEVSGASTLRKK